MSVEIIVIAAVLLLPVLLVCLIAALNRKKQYRYEQALTPWLALLYAVLCCVFFRQLYDFAVSLSSQPAVAQAIAWLNTKSSWLMGTDLFVIYVLNMLLFGGFFALKAVTGALGGVIGGLGRCIRRLFSRQPVQAHQLPDYASLGFFGRLHWGYINLFYHIDQGSGTVRSRVLPVGKVFRYGANILACVYLACLCFCLLPLMNQYGWFPYAWVQQALVYVYVWPAISLVLLKEIAYYLDGMPLQHLGDEALISCSSPEKMERADYSQLAEHYEKQFPERFVASLHAPVFPVDERPAEPKSDLARAILQRLKEEQLSTNTQISQSVMDCVTALPERENALIDSVLSAEMGDCLMLYLNVLLARGENLLVLCEDEDACNEVRDYVTEKLAKINLFAPVWIVKSVGEAYAVGDCDVLVLTPQAVMNSHVQHARSSFFRHLTTVLMVNGSRLVSEMGGLLTVVSGYLAREKAQPIQYICLCNGISGELRTTLEQVLSPGRAFRPYECFKSNESNRILLWNYEAASGAANPRAQQNLFHEAMDHAYLGVMAPLAFVGAQKGVNSISLMGKEVPSRELISVLQASFSQMRQYFGSQLTLNELTDRLAFNRIDAANPFVVALDETFNLPMVLRNYCRQMGRETSMVHIVSKPYMLRDYFSAHAAAYLKDRKKAEMFAPILTDTRKMLAIKLIADAAAPGGVEEEKMVSCMRSIEGNVKTLHEALEECYRIVCNGVPGRDVDEVFSVSAENVYAPEKNAFVRRRMVHLTDNALFERVVGDIHPATVQLHDKTVSLGIGRRDVYRYHLPDQAMIVDGSMYYIDAIDAANGQIVCGRKISAMDLPTDYYQHRQYRVDLRGDEAVGTFVDMRSSKVEKHITSGYTTTLYRKAQMSVETKGFFAPAASSGILDLTDRTCYRALPEKVQQEAFRSKNNASVLSVCFHGVDAGAADSLAYTMAVLLGELMKTYFPYNWPCIAVCPVLHTDELRRGSMLRENMAALYPQVEAVQAQPLAADAAQILIIEDSENDTGILEALCRNRITPLSSAFSLLLDYLKWRKTGSPNANIPDRYLHFGSGSVPDVLQLDMAAQMLQQLETVHPSGIVWVSDNMDSTVCYFCHKNLYLTDYVQLLGDDGKRDRVVCKACAQRLLSKKEELAPLYKRTKEYLKNTWGAELPKGLKVKFVSASTIKKQFRRNQTRGRVIGLAQKLSKTVWVETLSPEEHILSTLVHELTHHWQFVNIKTNDLVAMEGHASYMEVQFLRAEGYEYLARRTHENLLSRTDDEYGQGYVALTEAMKTRTDKNPFTYMLETHGKVGRVKKSEQVEVDGDA